MLSEQSTLYFKAPSSSSPYPLHLRAFVPSIWDNLFLALSSNQNPFPHIDSTV